MAKEIKLLNPAILVFKNPYDKEACAGYLWNTGFSAAGKPHADEDPENTGKGIIAGEVGPAFERKHIAAIRLYKNNEYVYLNPGDILSLKVDNMNALAYYLGIGDSDLLVLTNRADFEEEIVEG